MSRFKNRDLVFLNKSIFKEQTGWRSYIYAPVGWQGYFLYNMNCSATWLIAAAVMLEDGYLLYIVVK